MIVGKGFGFIVNQVAATASTRAVGSASSAASSGVSPSANLTTMRHLTRFRIHESQFGLRLPILVYYRGAIA